VRYQVHLFNHTGSRAIVDRAMYECSSEPDSSIADLEMVMRRSSIPMPAD